jgi:hypothetical protein
MMPSAQQAKVTSVQAQGRGCVWAFEEVSARMLAKEWTDPTVIFEVATRDSKVQLQLNYF